MKKKLLSLALAAVMVMSLSATALASEVTATSGDDVVSFTKTYTITGTAPEETFYLIQNGDGTVSDSSAEEAPTLDIIEAEGVEGSVVASVTLSGSSTVTGTFTIGLPVYNEVGVYTYELNEVAGDTAGVTYASEKLYLVVYVTNGDDGKLTVCQTNIYKESVATANKIDNIDNTYEAGSLEVSKEVTGNTGDKDEEFTVTVTFTSENTVNSIISYTVGETNYTIEPSAWTDGSVSVEINIADSDTVAFTNIPAGVTYTVEENDYTNEGYDEATYTFSDSEKTIDGTEKDTAKITNNRETDVDTGINLDTLPYIMILAVVFAGAAYMVVRKRMSDRY